MKTISYITIAALAVVALAFAFSGKAFAAGEWANNNLGAGQNAAAAGECPVAMIGNFSTGEGIYGSNSQERCWASSISTVEPGETVNVLVKLKNLGPDDISNATVHFSNLGTTSPTTSHSIKVTLNGDSVASRVETVRFNISSAQTVTYIGHNYEYFDTHSNRYIGSRGFSGTNLYWGIVNPIGDVDADDYGYLVVALEVGDDRSNPNPPNPPGPGTENPWVELIVDDNTIDEGDDLYLRWDTNNDVVRCDFDSSPNTEFEFNSDFDINGSQTLDDMNDGTYVFTITCYSPNGVSTYDRQTVYVDRDNDNNNNDEPEADTDDADDVRDDSAELNGSVDMNDFRNGIVFFVYGQDKDQIEDVDRDYDRYSEVDEDGDDLQKVRVDNDLDDDDDYAEDVDNLDEDEKYYYQICVEFENNNNREELECGGVESFTTDDDSRGSDDDDEDDPSDPGGVDPVNLTPIIITLPESGISQTTAVINGGYNANGCDDFKTYFLVGKSPNALTIDTRIVNRGNTHGVAREQLSNLTPGGAYYYQFIGNCEGVPIYGNVESFRTTARLIERPVTPVTPVVPVTPVTPVIQVTTLEAGSGLGCLDLDITNNTETLSRGQQTTYFVEWNNLCEQDFEDAVLDVKLPKDLAFLSTTRGTYTGANEHSVIVSLGDIERDEDGDMLVTAQVRGGAATGDVVVVEANLGGDGIGNDIQDTAIEFDFDTLTQSRVGLGAFALGTGFFGSAWGWLGILFLLALVILAARYFYVRGARNERAYAFARPGYVAPGYAHSGYAPAPQQYAAAPVVAAPPVPAPAPTAQAPAPSDIPTEDAAPAFQEPDYTTYRPKPVE